MTSAEAVLAAAPAVVAFRDAGVRLDRDAAALEAQLVAARRKNEELLAAHRVALERAVAAARPVPPRPVLPDTAHLDQATALVNERRRRQSAGYERALAVDADRIEAAIAARLAEIQARCQPLLAELRACRAEADELAAVRANVFAAVDARAGRRTHPSRAERVRRFSDMDVFVAAIDRGRPLGELRPVAELLGPRVEAYTAADAARQIPRPAGPLVRLFPQRGGRTAIP